MKKIQKILFILILIIMSVSYAALKINISYDINIASADDESSESSESSESRESSSDDYKIVKEEKTIVVEPAKVIYETQLQNVTLIDSDRDGIADEYDSHPNLAEVYLVQDNNTNGIVDIFEDLFNK